MPNVNGSIYFWLPARETGATAFTFLPMAVERFQQLTGETTAHNTMMRSTSSIPEILTNHSTYAMM